MRLSQIHKIYISNFLTGLVFWYGIEKLFMSSIGIDAVGVGLATVVFTVFILLFDIPSGLLADKWSRKGVLIISALALGVSSIILGSSDSLTPYIIGELFYGVYVVATSGTYQAITYDSLHEEGRSHLYSKIMGRAYALFLAGAGMANIASGFLASHFSFRVTFFITVISCAINIVLMLTLREPTYHKPEKKERVLSQLHQVSRTLMSMQVLKVLVIIMSALAVVELFKSEFGQLYMLRYLTSPELLGIAWAVYAFAWAYGSFIAHYFRDRVHLLVILSTLPYIVMSCIDHWFSLILFMLQAIAGAALINQVETRVQENTPSSVRASVLSVVSALGRTIAVPASLLLGWIIRDFGSLWALRSVTVIAFMALLYWFWSFKKGRLKIA